MLLQARTIDALETDSLPVILRWRTNRGCIWSLRSPHLRTNTFYLLFLKVLDFMGFRGGFRIRDCEWTCVTPDTCKHRYNDCQCSILCFQNWDSAAIMWVLWNLSGLSPPFSTRWRHRELVTYARLCRKLMHEQGIISESMMF